MQLLVLEWAEDLEWAEVTLVWVADSELILESAEDLVVIQVASVEDSVLVWAEDSTVEFQVEYSEAQV